MNTYTKKRFKFVLGFVACLLDRLIPFRPPNIEPVLAVQMPFSKAYGAFSGFLFASMSIVLFDLIVGKIGVWTLITALAYGILGFCAALFFKHRRSSVRNYALFAVMGTLFYDAVTGLSIGPLFFGQSFMSALVGQLPFTMMHLLGNVTFAVIVSPALYTHVVTNKALETTALLTTLKQKFT